MGVFVYKNEKASKYIQVFINITISNDELGRTGIIKHTINTGDAPPTLVPPRRLPKHRQAEATTLVQQMLEKKIITPSQSPWSAPYHPQGDG